MKIRAIWYPYIIISVLIERYLFTITRKGLNGYIRHSEIKQMSGDIVIIYRSQENPERSVPILAKSHKVINFGKVLGTKGI
jgi:hypothetical protein